LRQREPQASKYIIEKGGHVCILTLLDEENLKARLRLRYNKESGISYRPFFNREFYIFQSSGDGKEGLRRIFGDLPADFILSDDLAWGSDALFRLKKREACSNGPQASMDI
jgi:hypothetical protein